MEINTPPVLTTNEDTTTDSPSYPGTSHHHVSHPPQQSHKSQAPVRVNTAPVVASASSACPLQHIVPSSSHQVTGGHYHQQQFYHVDPMSGNMVKQDRSVAAVAPFRPGTVQSAPIAVRLYDHYAEPQHLPQPIGLYPASSSHYPRQPFPAMYPTPPLPSSISGHKISLSHYSAESAAAAALSAATAGKEPPRNLQPLSIFTERQACTALSPPCDIAKYAQSCRGLLMTANCAQLPAPFATEDASGNGQGHGTVQGEPPPRKKRGHDFVDHSSCQGENSSSKKGRFTFSGAMLEILEQRFTQGRYITAEERIIMARKLGIADVQVKNWFQNRRMKWKRQCGSMSSQVSSSIHHPTPIAQHTVSTLLHSTKEEGNQQSSRQIADNVPATSCSATLPAYASSVHYAAPSRITQRASPKELVSSSGAAVSHNTGIHPMMYAARGYAYPVPVVAGGAGYGFQMYMPESHTEEPKST